MLHPVASFAKIYFLFALGTNIFCINAITGLSGWKSIYYAGHAVGHNYHDINCLN